MPLFDFSVPRDTPEDFWGSWRALFTSGSAECGVPAPNEPPRRHLGLPTSESDSLVGAITSWKTDRSLVGRVTGHIQGHIFAPRVLLGALL